MKCLFIHIRDLRFIDNSTYSLALKKYTKEEIFSVFFRNSEQINGQFSSPSSVKFFTEVLTRSKIKQVKVRNLNDISKYILSIKKKHPELESLAFHYDYTPYAKKRELLLNKVARDLGLEVINTHDQLLLNKFHVKKDGSIYYKFTPYYNSYPKGNIKKVTGAVPSSINAQSLKKVVANYSSTREIPSHVTTRLSHYLKFGVISPRQAYVLFKGNEVLSRQLIWRDFYYTYYNFTQAFEGDVKSDTLWENNPRFLRAWISGKTGFPIIDAGMRQLKNENYMHNRVRMITANFLTKILHVNWKHGEKHFSKTLIDIDRIQNTAGWHSVSSLAKHSLPYFRIFNPTIQAKKYDSNAEYIKQYVPELRKVPVKDILNWKESPIKLPDYPKPIVDYNTEKQRYLKFKSRK